MYNTVLKDNKNIERYCLFSEVVFPIYKHPILSQYCLFFGAGFPIYSIDSEPSLIPVLSLFWSSISQNY
jgi:hypothetical protein